MSWTIKIYKTLKPISKNNDTNKSAINDNSEFQRKIIEHIWAQVNTKASTALFVCSLRDQPVYWK